MKDQYFGDVNDFRKYGLLRSLITRDDLCLGVCWMLTESDGRPHGSLLEYLAKPKEYRYSDPELFDWLKEVIEVEQDRRTARIEASGLLGSASFKSNILTHRENERREYFSDCTTRFAGCDLVFFDPDNGLEVKSISRGRKDSRKYLYWDEVRSTFTTGSSVLIYQHFPRERHSNFVDRMTYALQERIDAATVFSFTTPQVLFLLASQERHAAAFRERFAAIRSVWAPAQMLAAEHRRLKDGYSLSERPFPVPSAQHR